VVYKIGGKGRTFGRANYFDPLEDATENALSDPLNKLQKTQ
jgi:hypothetical protein